MFMNQQYKYSEVKKYFIDHNFKSSASYKESKAHLNCEGQNLEKTIDTIGKIELNYWYRRSFLPKISR